ncbi:EAL domain-containing protein [Eubacteriaceae bacterium ES3]|nr:EAL domain-containing protein [Eubacteriaceae bacterium ES3]
MIFLLNTRFQIAAILFFTIIVYDFFKNLKLPLLSNKVFSAMLFFTGLYLILDITGVYTRLNMDTVSPLLLRTIHQLFISTTIIILMLLYLYVQILANNHKKLSKKRLLFTFAPLILMITFVFFGPLDYHVDSTSTYTTGPVSIITYFSVVFYISLTVIRIVTAGNTIHHERKISLITGTMIWVIASIVQFFNRDILISSMAVALMTLFIYLSFENPKEHFDVETRTLNKRAFHLMLNDQYDAKKNILLVSVVIDDLLQIQSTIGHSNVNQLLEVIANKMQTIFSTYVFHSRSNVLSVILHQPQNLVEIRLLEMEAYLDQMFNVGQFSVLPRFHIDIINTEVVKESCDEVYELMNYMTAHHQAIRGKKVYLLDDEIIAQKQRYTTIDKLLHHAIEHDGFTVVYQPIFDVHKKGFRSAEALVRLTDNQTIGFISPEEFIVIAERKGLIMDLGRIVFEKVCTFASKNKLYEGEFDYIEVNLSGIQCVHPDLPRQLESIMKEHHIPPAFLNLEITETASVESGEMLDRNMVDLRNLGCSFSMDDFGTGYSNLSKMSEVVYDLVKIDKSLIWPCFTNDNNQKSLAILKNMINMLLELNVKIVAEGIETKEMCDFLEEQNITYLQGYYFSKPISEDAFLEFLKNHPLQEETAS